MVISDSHATGNPAAPGSGAPLPARVVWHDLECGGYRADLPLWRELAQRGDGPVLDVGAGTGRVTLELARAGHTVTAVDVDPLLLAALRERATGLAVKDVCADARSFTLTRADFAVCLVPMQTIQLLGGSAGRVAFLRRARAHLRPGALIACAILGNVEQFDCADGQVGPAAERAQVGGDLYLSRATRVSQLAQTITIERERRVIDERPTTPARGRGLLRSGGRPELNVIELDRVSPKTLEREAREAGLRPTERREVPATDEHVGSMVVIVSV